MGVLSAAAALWQRLALGDAERVPFVLEASESAGETNYVADFGKVRMRLQQDYAGSTWVWILEDATDGAPLDVSASFAPNELGRAACEADARRRLQRITSADAAEGDET